MKKIKEWFYIKNDSEQAEINKQLIVIVASIFVTVVSVLGVTYSAFVWSDNSVKEQSLVAGYVELSIDSNSEPLGSSLNYPVAQENEESLTPYTFTITNNGNLPSKYELKIVSDDAFTNTMDTNYIYMSLSGTNNIKRTSLSTYMDKPIDSGYLQPKESKTYDLRLWIVENAPNSVIGQEWHGKIELDIQQVIDENIPLVNHILGENNANVITTEPTFSSDSTDRGLFVQQWDATKSIDGKATYYFKGSSTNETINPDYKMNNYVKFGKHASDLTVPVWNATLKKDESVLIASAGDDILWRVVRINEDGSIKLISDNVVATKGAWNSNNVAKYINDDGTPSTIKNAVETWYNNNIGNNEKLDNMVVESSFCSDISNNYEDAATRIATSTPNPTFICPEGALTIKSKVGLLTADELVYAGGIFDKAVVNNTTYLDGELYYWTITPHSSTNPFYWSAAASTKNINNSYPAKQVGGAYVRAVINLKADVTVNHGDGLSSSSAYFINQPN